LVEVLVVVWVVVVDVCDEFVGDLGEGDFGDVELVFGD